MVPPHFHYNEDRSHLTIDNSVTSIPNGSYPCIETIITVVLPAGLQKIGNGAFQNCTTSLRNIELNEGLESIGNRTFAGCTSIIRVCIPSTVTKIGGEAFNRCTSLTELQLREGRLREIEGSFQGCDSLTCITLPSTIKRIADGAFTDCDSLKEIHLNEGLHVILTAFQCCTSLTNIHIPSTLEFIGILDFDLMTSKKEGEGPFAGCTALTNIVIPSNVVAIGLGAFNECTSLTSVELRDGLRTISSAFQGCTSLTSIVIPSTFEILHFGAFDGCTSLTEVHLSEGISWLGTCFQHCTSLMHIRTPSSLSGCKAFDGCTALRELELCEGLKSIEGFHDCSLTHLTIPSTVTELDDGAFSGCAKLEEIHLNEGLQFIAGFYGCTSLKKISIPSTVTKIVGFSFGRCTSLTEVLLCEGLETIDQQAFEHCTVLTQISIPSTISELNMAFKGCTSLAEVQLCEGLKSINEFAFHFLPLLHLNIPSTVTVIEPDAFHNAPFLRNIAVSPSSALGEIDVAESFNHFRGLGCTYNALMNRFNELPVHRLCFHYWDQSSESGNSIELIKNLVNEHSSDCARVDCLGMTPLHVLVCSAKHDLLIYQFLIDKNPEALLVKDCWGEVPIVYLLISFPPLEVIEYFLKTHQRNWSGMPFAFKDMILKLAIIKSAECVRLMARMLLPYFPDLLVDWQSIFDFCAASRMVTLSVFRALAEVSMSTRSKCMSTEHKENLDELIDSMESELFSIQSHLTDPSMLMEIHRRVSAFTRQHDEFLMNVSTNLELALWRAVLTETSLNVDDSEARMSIRTNCGNAFQVAIPNVLSFL